MSPLADLRSLSFPIKGLLSAYLLTIGIGYLIAILYLFLLEVGPQQKVSVGMLQATIHKYYGNRGLRELKPCCAGVWDNTQLLLKKKIFPPGLMKERLRTAFLRSNRFSTKSASNAIASDPD